MTSFLSKESFQIIKNSISILQVCNYLGLDVKNNKIKCPFHLEQDASCTVYEDKNICKCYGCGKVTDQIGLWQHVNNFQFANDAAKDLCNTFGIYIPNDINSESSYRRKTNIPYNKNIIKKDTFESIYKAQKDKFEGENILKDTILHAVYYFMLRSIVILNGGNDRLLNSEDLDYLTKKRNFTNEKCKNELYFSFPKKYQYNDFMKLFLQSLKDYNIPLEILKKVPGFYFDKNSQEYHMVMQYNCIGLPLKNHNQKITRIQVRRNDKDSTINNKSSKYWHFSLPDKLFNKDNIEGVKAGSTAAVVIPEKIIDKKSIVITEGKFKAESISKHKGCISISIQGVSVWQPAIYELKKLKEIYPDIDTVYIAFDNDSRANMINNIMSHAFKLSQILHNGGFNVKYLVWKSKFGKGIDDALEVNNKCIYIKEKELWEKKFELIENTIKLYLTNSLGSFEKFKQNIVQNQEVEEFKNLLITTFEYMEDIPIQNINNIYMKKSKLTI